MNDRRKFLKTGAAASELLCCSSSLAMPRPKRARQRATDKIRYCLNMSTVGGHELTLPQQISLASEAGYDAIEPWIRDLTKYVESGGSLEDLKKQIDDAGLTVESAIGSLFDRVLDVDRTLSSVGRIHAKVRPACGRSDLMFRLVA